MVVLSQHSKSARIGLLISLIGKTYPDAFGSVGIGLLQYSLIAKELSQHFWKRWNRITPFPYGERPIPALIQKRRDRLTICQLFQKRWNRITPFSYGERPIPTHLELLEQGPPIPALQKDWNRITPFPYGERPIPVLLKALAYG